LPRRGSRESRGARDELLLPMIRDGQGRRGRKWATTKWASAMCRLTVIGKQIWTDGSSSVRNENRISYFVLIFSNNAEKEDKQEKIDRSLQKRSKILP
jgi:hypothetical protein